MLGGGLWLARVAADPLTVMTWNVENYVAEDRLVDGTYRPQYPKPEAAKAALRRALRQFRPDVLALQEMGPAPYLEELQRDLAREGLAYPHRALVDGPDAVRHLAVLARVPLGRVVAHAAVGYPWRGGMGQVRRGVLEVAIGPPGGEATLFVLHLKSRHTENADDSNAAAQRAGEAEAVRDLILRRFPDPSTARFLVLGDCNDQPRSRPLQALQRRGRTAVAELLAAADARGDSWTYYFRKAEEFARVDYVLVSPGLREAVVGGKAEVLDTPEIRAASDHRPLRVQLRPWAGADAGCIKAGPMADRPEGEGKPALSAD